jgi:hypothetical protein
MKLNMAIKAMFVVGGLTALTGCSSMLSVGEEQFTCQNNLDGAACVSAREAYTLTNTKDKLTSEDAEAIHAQKNKEKSVQNSQTESGIESYSASSSNNVAVKENLTNSKTSNPVINDYISGRDSVEVYQNAENIVNNLKAKQANSTYIAPGLMRQTAEIMRIWFAPRQDEMENFHMDKQIYVEVESKKWIFGEKGLNVKPNVTPMMLTNPNGVTSGIDGLKESDFVQGKSYGQTGNQGGMNNMQTNQRFSGFGGMSGMSGFSHQQGYGSGFNYGQQRYGSRGLR